MKKSPLARRNHLQRKKRHRQRTTRIQPVAIDQWRLAPSEAYALCKRIIRARSHGRCEAKINTVCTGRAKVCHHKKTRARGGTVADPNNCMDVCPECHEFIHAHPELATEWGMLISQFEPNPDGVVFTPRMTPPNPEGDSQ